jgi:endonuclease YncB( thermonuclease family)
MQEAVDDCRVEAEELVEDMSKKVATEVTQRREIERIVCRLQGENSQLQVWLIDKTHFLSPHIIPPTQTTHFPSLFSVTCRVTVSL